MDKLKIELVEETDVLEINDVETDDSFICCIIGGGAGKE